MCVGVAVLRKGRIAELHRHIAELEEDNRSLREAREGKVSERETQVCCEVWGVEGALITAAESCPNRSFILLGIGVTRVVIERISYPPVISNPCNKAFLVNNFIAFI